MPKDVPGYDSGKEALEEEEREKSKEEKDTTTAEE